ncbi:MAG: RagB/SusD family nutrient uptake outer membrane protein [Bacteroidales bacterium]|nr:RagB/SusD family nutrient uptake outer membrane protein [Bacteroidales bacterium]
MKMKNIISVASMIGFLVFIPSCTDLDETLYSELSESNISYTDEEVESMSGPVYTNLRYTYWAWEGLYDQSEESGDLIMTPLRPGVGWGAQYILMHKHTYNSSIGHFYQTWYYPYVGIGYCNKLLDLDGIKADKEKVAEFRAMRALYYYILLDIFRNVPLITTSDIPAGFLPEQEDPAVVFDFIFSELNEAKSDLPKTSGYGRMNYFAACMTLAKVYLNHNAWFYGNTEEGFTSTEWYQKALDEVNEVLANPAYQLAQNYKDPFMADASGCEEVIFAIPLDGTYASANYLSNKCLHSASAETFLYNSAPWDGSCALPQFIDTYDPDDKRKTDTWLIGPQYKYEKNGVPITIYQYNDYMEAGQTDGLVATPITVDNEPLNYTVFVHSIDNPGAFKMEGARFWKQEIVSGQTGTYGTDVCFYRLADAMFIKAECLLRLGTDKQTAADLVSEVRARSFPDNQAKAVRTIADLEGGSVYDYGLRETQLDANDKPVQNFTYEGGYDIELGGLLDDLAWEFVGEHHRRQDLIRFRLKDGSRNVFNGKSRFCYDASSVNPADDVKKDVYPIYQNFLDANIKLVQNPGYDE